MDHSLGVKRPITTFRSGGHVPKRSRFMENGIKNMDAKVEGQPNKSDKIKAMAQAPDLDSREADSGKTGVAAHTRKSSDSPAVVPIKKRRIQILEAVRSPSPPPSSPSPKATSPRPIPQESSPPSGEIRSSVVSSSSSLLGFSSASSPRSSVPIPMSSSIPQARPLPISQMQPLAREGGSEKVEVEKVEAERVEIAHVHKLDPKEQLVRNAKNYHDNADNVSTQQACIEDVNGQVLGDPDQPHSQVKQDGQLSRSESGSFSRDDRLHWDLNTDMEAWDASSEQIAVKISEGKEASGTPPRSSSVDSAGTSQDHRTVGYDDDAREQTEEDPDHGEEEPVAKKVVVEEDPDTLDEVLEEPDSGEETGEQDVEEPEIGEQVVEDPEIEEQMEEEPDNMEQDFSGNSEHRDTEKEEATPPSVHQESGWNAPDVTDFPESGKPSSLDADLSPEGRGVHELSETHCYQDDMPERLKPGKHGKSSSEDAEGWNYEPELEEHVDYGDSDCRDADDPGLELDERTSMMQEESDWKGEGGARSLKVTPGEGEALISGEAFTLADEPSAERYTPTGRSRTSGWDKLPEGFDSAEEALRAAKEGSARRGRGGSWSSPAGRGSLHSASRFGPGTIRSNARDGFSAARGESYYGDRHPDEAMYDRDGYRHGRRADDSFSSRGRDPPRRPGIFGRGRASGWIDSQPGHMNQWGPSRHRSGSGFSGPTNSVGASRVESSGFAVAPDGIGTKHGMGPGRGGIRTTVSGGRVGRGGYLRGPPVDMDGGVHYPLRPGAGADRVGGLGTGAGPSYTGGMHDRGGRGMMDRYRGAGMESRRSMSPRRPYHMDHPNMMGRMPGMRPDSRVVRSRTPPPTSHRSVGPSEFAPVRGQRSPPPASRWSSDKRETDGYQDRDFKRPLSRTRVPSQRTSPHVVHGSSLTDERDRQVLAGSRHSPPLKGSMAPTHLRKSKDDILDSRPSKRNEEDDARLTGSFIKDGDYRRSSPTREIDRDREKGSLYRRERDRDDERRRDTRRSSSRDGRFPGGPKHSGARDVDDDVAPRRRRPS